MSNLSNIQNANNFNNLDGLSVINADEVYIDGQQVNLGDYVPYTGSTKTLDMGAQNIQTTHYASVDADVVNNKVLSDAVAFITGGVSNSYLNKITSTSQTVVAPIQFQNVLTLDQQTVLQNGLKLNASPSGNWVITVEYIDANTQNLVFTSSQGAVFKISGDYGWLKSTGWSPNKVPIFNNQGYLVSSGVDSSKIIYLDNCSEDIQTALNNRLKLDGSNANQNINISSYKIQSLATPSSNTDYTNKLYVDNEIVNAGALYVKKTGDSMSGTLNMGSNTITTTRTPVSADDLTRKNYVDTQDAILQNQINLKADLSYVQAEDSSLQSQINAISGTFGSYLPLSGGNITNDLNVGNKLGVGTTSPVSLVECSSGNFNAMTLTRTGALANYGVGTVHSLISTTPFRAYYARALGGSAGTPATTSQSEANGYYLIDVANAGVFKSDTDPSTSIIYATGSNVRINGSVDLVANVITTTTNPTNNDQLTRKGWIDSQLSNYLLLTGGTLSGDLTVNGTTTSIGSRLLGSPDSSPGNFWIGLRGSGSELQRLAIGINGDSSTGDVSFVSISKTLNLSSITGSRALIIDASNNVGSSATTSTELSYLSGTTSSVQTQINSINSNFANFLPLGGGVLSGTLGITGNNIIDFGFGITKEPNAGRIGYQRFTTGCLDIVGAGTTSGDRRVFIYDKLGIGVNPANANLQVSGTASISSNVGIGTTNPLSLLHLNSTGTHQVRFQTSHVDNHYITAANDLFAFNANLALTSIPNSGRGSCQIILQTPTAGGLIQFMTGAAINTVPSEKMRLSADGNLGISTTGPRAKLDVSGDIITDWNNRRIGVQYLTSTSGYFLGMNTNANTRELYLDAQSADPNGTSSVVIRTGSSVERVRVNASGQVSIGTAVLPSANSPGTTTLVNYGNACLYRNRLIFSSGLTDWNHCIYNNYMDLDNEGSWDGMKMNVFNGLWVRTGNATGATPSTALYIDNDGDCGIGTTSLTHKLTVNGNTGLIGQLDIGVVGNTVPNIKFANSASHIDNNAGEVYLFTAYNGHIAISRNTQRDSSTANLVLGVAGTEESQIISTKTDNSGYMPMSFAASQYTFTNGNVLVNTNVGIGNSPSSTLRLEVSGASRFNNALTVSGICSLNGGMTPTTIISTTSDYTNTFVITTPWPSITFDNSALVSGGRKWSILCGGPGAGVGAGGFGIFDMTVNKYWMGINTTGNTTFYNWMRVDNGDISTCVYGPNATWNARLRVGSGTSDYDATTAQIISTNGNLHLDSGYSKDTYINYYNNNAGTLGTTYSYGPWRHNHNQFIFGNLGVGTDSTNITYSPPTVGKTLNVDGYVNGLYFYTSGSIGTASYQGYIQFVNGGHYIANINPGGTGHALAFNSGKYTFNGLASGTVAVDGSGYLYTYSDRRVKNSIQYFDETEETSLDKILSLRPCSFKLNQDPYNTKIGFIAQDVEEIIPNAVDAKKHEWRIKLNKDTGEAELDENGNITYEVDEITGEKIPRYRGLDTTAILAHSVRAVQEQQASIASAMRTISEQSKQIELLTERNQMLEDHARSLTNEFESYIRRADESLRDYKKLTEARFEKLTNLFLSLNK